ncbi:hypothetical protein GUJ93_ZPchr0004g38608 [Zizania palustris]|uniref:ELMO domain-containing protein n=1 Tax=Zizania palustris TaxID=103762 RepID=A0A8J5S193_ZIZPA|nr:hypothetical protein GUJ93_ZPchr0004g38608 [Zizania palustris]
MTTKGGAPPSPGGLTGLANGRFFTVGLVTSWYSSNISVLLLNKYLLSNYGFKKRGFRLRRRMKVYFDPSRRDHQEALRALWHATYPDQELQGLISEQWKDMGWQGRDPSIDFR